MTTTASGRTAVRLLGLSGSLRHASANTALLRAARELAPHDVEVRIHPLRDVPFFNADREHPTPDAVVALRRAVSDADGLLLASPEYNRSTTAVLKNAIDWASRGDPAPLDGKPAALLSAAGGSGGRGAQAHLHDILGHNHVDLVDQAVQIARWWGHFDGGRLVTEAHRRTVADAVAALVDRVISTRQERRAA